MAMLDTSQRASSEGQGAGITPRDRITVQVAPDLMSASVTILPPIEAEDPVTLDEILARLADAGVTYGIDPLSVEAARDAANRGLQPLSPSLVARGRPPQPGEDGTIIYHPALTAAAGRPKLLPDGTVDMFDLNAVHNVATGTVLANITLPTDGVPGMTVTGFSINAHRGQRATFKAGRGVVFDQDALTVTATIDGHAGLVQYEITVTDLYQVSGDLGLATGNIDFVGSVKVTGSVLTGYSLKANGDVDIFGSVEGASVEASGNVTVRGGIVGGRKGSRVKAGGSIKARFIESAEVSAGGSVWATDGIVQSRVEAGDTVEVLGKRGVIVGGTVVARNRVTARVLGSPLGNVTGIAVGVPPQMRTERNETQGTIKKLTEQMQQANLVVQATVDRIRCGDRSPHLRTRLAQATTARDEILETLIRAQDRQAELEREFREAHHGLVQASARCFPCVTVCVSGVQYRVPKEMPATRFFMDDQGQLSTASAYQ